MYDTGRLTQEALNRNQMIQPEIPNGMPVMNVIGEAPWMCITRITGRRRSPILSGFKDDLFNLEMENTAYESLKSSLPLPMDNSLDAYRLKSTRSPAQKLEVGRSSRRVWTNTTIEG
jgi:hypothetical protein